MALTLSGLPPHPFLFQGFLPPRAGPRAAEHRAAARPRSGRAVGHAGASTRRRTALAETLAALAEGLGADRPAAVARELTKRFEEVRRGTLAELAAHYASARGAGRDLLVVGPAPAEDAEAAEATWMRGCAPAMAAGSACATPRRRWPRRPACRASGLCPRAGTRRRAVTPARRILWTNILFGAGLALGLPWLAAGVLAHRWGPARDTLWPRTTPMRCGPSGWGCGGPRGGRGHARRVAEPLLVLTWLYMAARVTRGFLAWEREERITDPGRFL